MLPLRTTTTRQPTFQLGRRVHTRAVRSRSFLVFLGLCCRPTPAYPQEYHLHCIHEKKIIVIVMHSPGSWYLCVLFGQDVLRTKWRKYPSLTHRFCFQTFGQTPRVNAMAHAMRVLKLPVFVESKGRSSDASCCQCTCIPTDAPVTCCLGELQKASASALACARLAPF